MRCVYDQPWVGQCKAEAIKDSDPPRCKGHTLKCSNKGCSNPAIAGCPEAGSLVCGGPFCKECGMHKRGSCYFKKGM